MNTVQVRLRKPTRVFTFLCGELPLKRKDACIVNTDRGHEYGVCILPPTECPPTEERRHKMQVVRAATPDDENTLHRIEEDERRAKELCARKVSDRRLPMKLVDVEYTFDHHKVIFYFTAEQRVDFRDLVRDLAHDLKARIELRHIQVRDEAKLVGGIGLCGRELCCSSWLREFFPISMKMAKRQNLSLNPSKISGQCGRLLCCLSYENDQYPSGKKPKTDALGSASEEAVAMVGSADELEVAYEDAEGAFVAFTEIGAPVTLLDEEPASSSSVVDISTRGDLTGRPSSEADEEEIVADDEDERPPSPQNEASGDASGQARKRRRRRRKKPRGQSSSGASN